MPATPRRMRQNSGPDLRAQLRDRLVKIRDALSDQIGTDTLTSRTEHGWPYEHTTAARMAETYGLDRIDAIDRGDPVPVKLWEVLGHEQRPGADPHAVYTLDAAGSLIWERPLVV